LEEEDLMVRTIRRFRMLFVSGLVALSLAGFTGIAAAESQTVTLPCGCHWTIDNNGVAAYTPAVNNGSSQPGTDVKPYGAVVTFGQ
jgi:hypothetical protein